MNIRISKSKLDIFSKICHSLWFYLHLFHDHLQMHLREPSFATARGAHPQVILRRKGPCYKTGGYLFSKFRRIIQVDDRFRFRKFRCFFQKKTCHFSEKVTSFSQKLSSNSQDPLDRELYELISRNLQVRLVFFLPTWSRSSRRLDTRTFEPNFCITDTSTIHKVVDK